MKAKIIKTGEIVDVYHESQHGQITNIYKESVLVNGRMWTEDELDFSINLESKEVDINEEAKRKWDSFSLCYDESMGCDVVVWPYWVYKQVCKHFFELGLKAQK